MILPPNSVRILKCTFISEKAFKSSYIETTYKMHVSIFLICIVIVLQIVFFNIRPCTSRHLRADRGRNGYRDNIFVYNNTQLDHGQLSPLAHISIKANVFLVL